MGRHEGYRATKDEAHDRTGWMVIVSAVATLQLNGSGEKKNKKKASDSSIPNMLLHINLIFNEIAAQITLFVLSSLLLFPFYLPLFGNI